MKFIDFFSGIGGFHTGLEKAGMKCVGWCEFDKFAQASYHEMYDTNDLWFGDDVPEDFYLSKEKVQRLLSKSVILGRPVALAEILKQGGYILRGA